MYCSVLSSMVSATIVAHSSAPQQFHSTSSTTKLSHHNNIASTTKAIAHYTKNATLHTLFHQSNDSGRFSNYSQSLGITTESVSEEHQIPHGTFIQPFGSTIVVDSHSFRILAHSENAGDMLGIAPETFALGTTDVRSLLTHSSAQLLQKAFTEREISLANPILIHSRTSGKPFNGILHRIDSGIVIDLEPATLPIAGTDHSQKLSELLSLPGGDVKLLCNTVVDSVREMTGYDRVMVYKFHEDDHGEVVAESKRPDLEPYIGLHYPATDIPEASRVSFMQNRVISRMIVDCHASPVRMVQDETLVQQPVCLVGSTLRAPHGCHVQYMANMGSIATLVMAVIVNENGIGDDESCKKKLWGLVICHHGSPKCVPFPLRSACESLVQAFGVRLNMEKRVWRTRSQSSLFTFPAEDGILGELSLRIGESSANLCFL